MSWHFSEFYQFFELFPSIRFFFGNFFNKFCSICQFLQEISVYNNFVRFTSMNYTILREILLLFRSQVIFMTFAEDIFFTFFQCTMIEFRSFFIDFRFIFIDFRLFLKCFRRDLSYPKRFSINQINMGSFSAFLSRRC